MNRETPTWLAVTFAVSFFLVYVSEFNQLPCEDWLIYEKTIECEERKNEIDILGIKFVI